MGQIDVINQALSKLGERRITSLDDKGKAAGLAAGLYDQARDSEIAGQRWGFATRRVMLPAEGAAPAFGHAYQYVLPADFLRLLELGGWPAPVMADYVGGDASAHSIEGGRVLCGYAPPLALVYLARVIDAAAFPSPFVDVLASRLAVEMAEALTGSNSKREMAWKEYQEALRKARRWGAIQAPPQHVQDDSWLMARF